MPARGLTGTSGMRQKPSERRWVTQHVEICLGRVRRDRFQENWTALPTISKEPEPKIGARDRRRSRQAQRTSEESKRIIVSAAPSRTSAQTAGFSQRSLD